MRRQQVKISEKTQQGLPHVRDKAVEATGFVLSHGHHTIPSTTNIIATASRPHDL